MCPESGVGIGLHGYSGSRARFLKDSRLFVIFTIIADD